MITRCDHCGSKFEVSAELVNSSDPGVRCGECLSLFDARANLFNEAEYRKTAATLRPVQRRPLINEAETVDADILETADTVAVEHIYTSAGVKNKALSTERNNSAEHSHYDVERAGIDHRHHDNEFDHGAKHQQSAYRIESRYPSDIEFEHTLATESALPERAYNSKRVDNQLASGSDNRSKSQESSSRSDRRSTPMNPTDTITSQEAAVREMARRETANRTKTNRDNANQENANQEKDAANRKRQQLRDQEQRALQIEPERDFGALDSIDVALDQSRLDEENREAEISRRGLGRRPSVDERRLARDTRIVNRSDTHFIPDDVLNRPAIIRDNGRRPEEATNFKADTPEFDIALDDDLPNVEIADHQEATAREFTERERPEHLRSRPVARSIETDLAQPDSNRPVEGQHAEKEFSGPNADDHETSDQDSSLRRGAYAESRKEEPVIATPQQRSDRSGDAESDPQSNESYRAREKDADENSIHESSAQEMRRYQHYRPAVEIEQLEVEPQEVEHQEVEQVDDDLMVQNSSRTVTQPKSGAGALFWMAGLILAVGLLLFAARGLIANMNLPEPVVTAFCQVTGCVPDQAKKNVAQLQTMRKRLYPHPEIENAIVISVDVVNNSIYKQPMPTLAVSLLNEDDQTIAERDFASADYEVVDGGESGYLMPDEPTRIKIEVVDTGLGAADVELAFK